MNCHGPGTVQRPSASAGAAALRGSIKGVEAAEGCGSNVMAHWAKPSMNTASCQLGILLGREDLCQLLLANGTSTKKQLQKSNRHDSMSLRYCYEIISRV